MADASSRGRKDRGNERIAMLAKRLSLSQAFFINRTSFFPNRSFLVNVPAAPRSLCGSRKFCPECSRSLIFFARARELDDRSVISFRSGSKGRDIGLPEKLD